ncbi:MAG: hypothetical protein FGM37_01815 [Phycisphaerales bacterium]|nr:hypothetical protein [Phycisphaerales bacterium]
MTQLSEIAEHASQLETDCPGHANMLDTCARYWETRAALEVKLGREADSAASAERGANLRARIAELQSET